MTRTPLLLCFALACGDTTLRPSLSEPRTGFSPDPGSTSGAGAGTGAGGTGAGTGAGGTGAGIAGSGGGTGTGGGTPQPQCADALKRCAVDFTYPASAAETSVEVRGDFAPDGWTRGVAMVKSPGTWRASVPVPWGQAVLYKFVINGGVWVLDPANPSTATSAGATNSLRAATTCPQSFTCDEPTPEPGTFDWRDAVIYSVVVDRFSDGNPANNCNVPSVQGPANYAGGDWKGVTAKVTSGYFDALGVNTLLLTDVVDNFDGSGAGADGHAYSAYHGYWPLALDRAESCFGTEAELKELVDTAHAKGIKVLLDYAMVHVHSSSAVYAQHPDWFWPLSFNGGDCICSDSGVCPWGAQGHRCWFTNYLPHWNYTNAAARAYSVGNVIDWVKRVGFDGIRADAVKHIDGSWLLELRARLASELHLTQRFYMVGETYDFGNAGYLKSFIDPATRLDGQFDFPLRRVLLQTTVRGAEPLSNLKDFMDGNDSFYGPDAVMSTWIGNHDLGRVIHMAERPPRWDQYDNGSNCAWNAPGSVQGRAPYERLGVAFGVLLTSRGAPLLYYGDEIGLAGCGDPDNRRVMPWAGHSADQQWLKDRLARLGTVRAAHAALRRGTRTTLSVNADTWLYSMRSGAETLYVAINRGDATATVTGLPAVALDELIEGASITGPSATVPARQVRIWEPK